MTHQLFHLPRPTAISSNLTLVAGAKVNFFLTGTSTLTNTYQDSGLTTPHTNPVVADAAGRLPAIYLNPAIVYRITFTDSADVDIYPAIDPANDQLLSQASIGGYLYPRTTAEIAAGVTPTNYWYVPGHVYRYGTNTTPGTTNMTTALQAALDSNDVVYLPSADLSITNVTLPPNRTIIGEGPRNSRLIQPAGTTGYAIDFEDLASSDISEGATWFQGFAIHVATTSHGLHMDGVNASMFLSDNFRLYSRHAESLGSPPYTTTTDQRGIFIENGSLGSIFFAHHRNLEIRSFDIGIDAADIVNEWSVHGWILDCRIAIRLTDCSTWDMSGVTVESGVSAARALQIFGAVSNLKWIGGRWELTRPTSEGGGCWGIEGDGTTTGDNWRFAGINVLIDGDGSAIPGTGTVPDDFVFEGYDTTGPFLIIPNLITMRLPNLLTLGGQNLGNALITLGRNAGGAACTIGHDGTHMEIKAGNSLELFTGGTLPAATLDDTAVAGNTRLLVFDVDNNQIERVTVGAADSGGAGFKLLRIPN
jgi:hypothetical protein